jgi:hypothetical protein
MLDPQKPRIIAAIQREEMFAGLAVVLACVALLAVFNGFSAGAVGTLVAPFFFGIVL